jgi:hypothetical protein
MSGFIIKSESNVKRKEKTENEPSERNVKIRVKLEDNIANKVNQPESRD